MTYQKAAVALLAFALTLPATVHAQSPGAEDRLRPVALEAGLAPASLGGTYAQIRSGASNDAGRVAFVADLASSSASSALLLVTEGTAEPLARSGDEAPGGGHYTSFEEVDLGNAGHVLFRARLDDGAAEGVFLWHDGEVLAIARAGDVSPKGQTFATFSQLTVISDVASAGTFYKLAFVATMTDGRKAILFARSNVEGITQDLTTDDVFVVSPALKRERVRDFAISRLGLSLCVVGTMKRKGSSAIYKRVFLHDGFTVFNKLLKQGARFRDLGRVADLYGPPSMNIQTGFVNLEFAGSVSALSSWSLDQAQIVSRTGDVLEGVPEGDTIGRFGPPVSNSLAIPEQGIPYGVVVPVTLGSGRQALFLGAYGATLPQLQGFSKVIFVDGTGFGSELEEFAPVKLSNTGTLLLSGRLAATGQRGLFVLDGLFEDIE